MIALIVLMPAVVAGLIEVRYVISQPPAPVVCDVLEIGYSLSGNGTYFAGDKIFIKNMSVRNLQEFDAVKNIEVSVDVVQYPARNRFHLKSFNITALGGKETYIVPYENYAEERDGIVGNSFKIEEGGRYYLDFLVSGNEEPCRSELFNISTSYTNESEKEDLWRQLTKPETIAQGIIGVVVAGIAIILEVVFKIFSRGLSWIISRAKKMLSRTARK